MSKFLLSKDKISICHKGNCIEATGTNASVITFGVATMLILFGISELSKNA